MMKMSEQMSKAQKLINIIKDRKFRVPLYQRNYKWDMATAVKLVEDLIASYNKHTTKSIGLITLYKDKENLNTNAFEVIDGQQRLITFAILFSLLGRNNPNPIDLYFERDNNNVRKNALNNPNNQINSTDTDRINRNRKAISDVLQNEEKEWKQNNKTFDTNKFADYVLENCIMLCTITENPPIEEFMNLNAYKTAFSVCDYNRANLIMLNTFYKDNLKDDKNIPEIFIGFPECTYKNAVAELYNKILDILYDNMNIKGDFSSVYKVLVDTDRYRYIKNPDTSHESRINIFFGTKTDTYRYEPEEKDFEGWKKLLAEMSYVYRMIKQLQNDMSAGDFSSAKIIDNYETLTKNSFVRLLSHPKKEDEKLSLAELLNKYSKVRKINKDNWKLANRYFEAYISAEKNKKTNNNGEANSSCKTPYMSEKEIIASIGSTGRYVMERFLRERHSEKISEQHSESNIKISDTEILNLGGQLEVDENNDSITVEKLFENKIKIPVIQRDYCMGSQLCDTNNPNNFLAYLIGKFENKSNEKLNVSTILLSKEKDKDAVYIFDGQQRIYTIYQILIYLGKKDFKDFEFIGRGNRPHGSSYSSQSVNNLNKKLDNELKEFNEQKKESFVEFLLKQVTFTVKQLDNVSSAEQFFMDINGGVQLEPYEIYKSCLYSRLMKLDKEFAISFTKKLENDWLQIIYNLLKKDEPQRSYINKMKSITKLPYEKDDEELAEIRLIEYLCRYFYMSKANEKVDVFDALSSKSMVVENTMKYLDKLDIDDFKNIQKCMDTFMKIVSALTKSVDKNSNIKYNYIAEVKYSFFDYNSTNYNSLCIIEKTASSITPDNIIPLFVSSFSPAKREYLMIYYSCKNTHEGHKWLIENVYDNDQYSDYAIKSVLGEDGTPNFPDYEDEIAKVILIGGYNVCRIYMSSWKYPKEISEFKICKKEIPVYYTPMYNHLSYVIRPYYLYHEINQKYTQNPPTVTFFLTNAKTIRLPNDRDTHFALSRYEYLTVKHNGQYLCIYNVSNPNAPICLHDLYNRTDAYLIKDKDTKKDLLAT